MTLGFQTKYLYFTYLQKAIPQIQYRWCCILLYSEDLETIILNRHEIIDADELIVISGYVGPTPIIKLNNLPINSTVVYGMYRENGISPTLHRSFLNLARNNGNKVKILYSEFPVHSKCYIWKKGGNILHVLIGSANFTFNGLNTPFRETLAEATADTFTPIKNYTERILANSILCTNCSLERTTPTTSSLNCLSSANTQHFCSMSLLDPRTNNVPPKSGLNWGFANNHHSEERNDAYIPIRTFHIDNFPMLFPPKQERPTEGTERGRRTRHNDKIEIIWDDQKIMDGLLEGSLRRNDIVYPKQISSFPEKSKLGEYIRNRINVPLGTPVTKRDLDRYGRSYIDVSLIGEGIYYFNFSVPTDNYQI